MNRKTTIAKTIISMSGSHSAYEIFCDWIRCMAMSIANATTIRHDEIYQEREKLYLDTIQRYSEDDRYRFAELLAYLIESMEDGPIDILGEVYMEAEMGSKTAGQFFTPFSISELCARLGANIERYKDNEDIITLTEPSCGGGGMILATAKIFADAGIEYQKRLRVVAQDLDWKGVYMTYVQLSLLGIDAICVQGDTLTEPYDIRKTPQRQVLRSPRNMGALLWPL